MGEAPGSKKKVSARWRSSIGTFRDKVADMSWGLFGLATLGGFLIVGYQLFVWLKTARWLALPFGKLFLWLDIDLFTPVQKMKWKGLQKILVWCLNELPLSVGIPILGALFASLFYALLSRKKGG
jgi:hypothetical protein